MNKINSMFLSLALGLTCVALAGGCGKGSAATPNSKLAEAARAKLTQLGEDYSPTAFFHAAGNGNLELVALFLDAGMSVSTRLEDAKANTDALFFACVNQQDKVVSLLLARGADPNVDYHQGGTPLVAAATKGHTTTMQLLINKGAKVNASSKENGITPLMFAAVNGRADAVKLLIEKGAKVNAEDNDGITALMQACAGSHPQVVEELIRAGASVDATNKEGRTALMHAAFKGDAESTQILLKKGAKRDSKDVSGKNALDFALRQQQQDVVKLLQ
jgi:ankyrin repeat protein